MVRTRRLLVILGVTRIALRRHTQELSGGRTFVAGVTVHGSVSSDQREAVLVLLDLLDRDLPALDGMALLATCAKLALVDVGVAIGAAGAGVGEYRLGVTLGAGYALVHASQWEPGLVVIKLREGPDGFPAIRRMTILAGDGQRAMRTAASGVNLRLPAC